LDIVNQNQSGSDSRDAQEGRWSNPCVVALATMLAAVPATALPANAHTVSHTSGTRSLAELLATDSSGFDTNWSDYTSSTTPSGPC